jgi:hypothetical protein
MTSLWKRIERLESWAGPDPERVKYHYLRVNALGWTPTDADMARALEADRERWPWYLAERHVYVLSPFCDQV